MTNISTENKDIDEFLSILAENFEANSTQYDGSKLILKIISDFANVKSTAEKVFNDIYVLTGNSIEIKLSTCKIDNIEFFYGIEDFLQKYDRVKKSFDVHTIIIIKDNGNNLVKKANESYNKNNKLIINIHEYKQVLAYFLNTPEFTPYVSETDNQFTLISKTHGVFNIGYVLPEVNFFESLDLKNLFNRFKQEFKKKEFIQFFKEVVISGVHNAREENRFNKIIREHNSLLNLAKRDYETYVSNFAFDKIKSEFKEERGVYFDSIDKNISSIGKQVISFPLTFGATIFASYKVKEQPEFLFLIFAAYILYTIVAFLVLNMTAYNVKCLRKDVKQEEDTIRHSYGVIYADFKNDFKKIKHKIINLRIIIGVLYFILLILLCLFTVFIFYQINTLDISQVFSSN